MKLFTCTDHDGHYPVGVASIVLASSEEEARGLLIKELEAIGLKVDDFTLQKVPQTKSIAIILQDGEY